MRLTGVLFAVLCVARCPAQALSPRSGRSPEVAVDASWALLAATDVDLSHRCIAAHTCREANPILSGSLPRSSTLEAAETLGSMWIFHRMRQSHPKLAWMIPAVNLGLHGAALYEYERKR